MATLPVLVKSEIRKFLGNTGRQVFDRHSTNHHRGKFHNEPPNPYHEIGECVGIPLDSRGDPQRYWEGQTTASALHSSVPYSWERKPDQGLYVN